MPAGLSVAIAMLAPAATGSPAGATTAAVPTRPAAKVYGPAAPAPPAPAKAPLPTADRVCAPTNPDPDKREIVVCAQRPQGYRLNPDILEAKREMRSGGRPHNPHEAYRDNSCAMVGPMGCRGGPTINLIAAAQTAITMANRLSKGQEIGSMFQTEPTPSEYQLYLEAKKRREAKEAEAAAAAKAKAAAAAKAAAQAAVQTDAAKTEAKPAK